MATLDELLADPIVCPTCGCPDARVIAKGTRWGKPTLTRRCAACARTWTAIGEAPAPDPRRPKATPQAQAQAEARPQPQDNPPDAIDFIVMRCPACRSRSIPVTHSSPPIRYHHCRDCGWTFKSIEREREAA